MPVLLLTGTVIETRTDEFQFTEQSWESDPFRGLGLLEMPDSAKKSTFSICFAERYRIINQ